ncbi:MAG: APH(3') family aminoglycoside O-phosphotransferase [Acidimicrobiales bacterium]|nr:APH(3') family aminoglycoside O-phosphotransferase [Acidimicrobiales bacterium]
MAAPGTLPEALADLVGDAEVVPITGGRSPAITAWVRRPDATWVLKVQVADDLETSLVGEAERARWLARHLPVPEVVASGSDGEHEWLLTTALVGSDATRPEHQMEVERLVHVLGEGLRTFHDRAPVDDCPFDATTPIALERARARMEAGRVDETDFEPLHAGLSSHELFQLMIDSVPGGDDDTVVLHGDYCVPNVILEDGAISGYVDLGRVGVGDRHRDLGIAARSIANNFGGHAVGPFLDAYGIDQPDLARLDFFVMLDEFF